MQQLLAFTRTVFQPASFLAQVKRHLFSAVANIMNFIEDALRRLI
jgi:hypothetical protein